MARDFNGSSDYISQGSVATAAQDNWTISALIYIDALPTTGATFDMFVYNGKDGAGTNDGYGFGVGGDNGANGSKLIGLYGGVAWQNTSHTFGAAATWYNVVMKREGADLNFWVNGTSVGFSNGLTPVTPTGNFVMGAMDRAGDGIIWFADGKIAEVGVWDRALTTSEIASLGKFFSPSFFKRNLKRYYNLIGKNSPERDLMQGASGTLTGTANFAHPRVIYPTNYQSRMVPVAAGGSIVLKTLDGLAQASIKTYQGLASASTKTWNGLSNV